jgi:PHP family Zn ribbon phosphoesterase
LWEQHRFDIGVESRGEWHAMEFIGNSLPFSSIERLDESSATFRIETATSQLEEHFQEAVVSLDAMNPENPAWNEIKALEAASLELYTESKNQLRNDHHLLLIPCLRLHLETCELLQERDPNLTKSQRISLLCRLASSAQSLLRLQEKLFGSDHFDLARTHLEFAQAMEELLSTAPKQIVQLGLPGLNTFEACSAAEHASRTEHERIKSLYPHNVQDLIRPHRKEQD